MSDLMWPAGPLFQIYGASRSSVSIFVKSFPFSSSPLRTFMGL